MNALDIIIGVVFVGVTGGGFFAGVARTSSLTLAMYFGIVLAATFYERLGDAFQRVLGDISEGSSYFAAFTLLFFGISLGFAYIIIRTTRPISPKRRFAIFDNIGGATLSVIVAFTAIAMALAITVIMIQAASSTSLGTSTGFMGVISRQIDSSSLAPAFLDLIPYIRKIVEPWFPGGLPPILTEAVR